MRPAILWLAVVFIVVGFLGVLWILRIGRIIAAQKADAVTLMAFLLHGTAGQASSATRRSDCSTTQKCYTWERHKRRFPAKLRAN